MNCVLYARVSTEQQAERELSIPAQLKAMREYATRHEWSVLEEFIEPGVSGRTAARPVLQALLNRCREKPQVDVVLVHKVDRLARNLGDHIAIRTYLRQHNITLASSVENVDDSITGQLVEHIMASIAQFYSANLGEEVKKGMRIMVERGGWPHRPPRGYRLAKDLDGKRCIELDEPTASTVRLAFEEYGQGHTSLRRIRLQLAEEGVLTRHGQPLPLEAVRGILINPFYAGRVRWRDAEYPGHHPALVSDELFDRVSRTLRLRRVEPGEKGRHHFPLRGVAVCAECGGTLTAEHHPRGSYYRCVKNTLGSALCRAPFSNVKVAHNSLLALYRQLHIPNELRARLQAAGDRLIDQRLSDAQRQLHSLRIKKTKLEEREMKITEAFSAGDVSLKAYRSVAGALRRQVLALDTAIQGAALDPTDLRSKLEHVLGVTESLIDLHARLSDDQRALLLRTIFRRLILEKGEITGYVLNPPFNGLLVDTVNSPPARDGSARPQFEDTQFAPTINSILEHDISQVFALCVEQRAA